MRPRLLHLGYDLFAQMENAAVFASMRPRLLHLGYSVDIIVQVQKDARFNEAEAFTPRIPTFGRRSASTIQGLQ